MNLLLNRKKISPELSYILGYMWADSSVSKKYNSVILECVKDDIDDIIHLFELFPSFKLKSRKRLGRKEQSSISICIKEFTDFLKGMGFLEKSIKSPDKLLEFIGNDNSNYFYRGISDGDGCFHHSKDFKLIHYVVSGSYDQDWGYMINLCRFLNIEKYTTDKILNENGHKHSRFRIINNKDIIKFGDFIYGGDNFGLSRKLNKFDSIKEYINRRIEQNKVYCYDLNGNLQFEFDSVKLASDWLNRKRYVGGDIIEVCRGTQKTAFGYIWKRELIGN
jgi:hypothetical protein